MNILSYFLPFVQERVAKNGRMSHPCNYQLDFHPKVSSEITSTVRVRELCWRPPQKSDPDLPNIPAGGDAPNWPVNLP